MKKEKLLSQAQAIMKELHLAVSYKEETENSVMLVAQSKTDRLTRYAVRVKEDGIVIGTLATNGKDIKSLAFYGDSYNCAILVAKGLGKKIN